MNAIRFPVKVKRLTETAILPTYGSALAAGMDLYADLPRPRIVYPGEHVLIPTGIAMALPAHLALLICPRSGLSAKSGITVHNGPGVIDADYRGDIGVILHNTTHQQFVVKPGDRIAQGVLTPVYQADFDVVDDLEPTDRGTGGFGSTGVSAEAVAALFNQQVRPAGEFITRPARPDEPGKVVEQFVLSSSAQLAARALSQDAHDRAQLAQKPLPSGITKWLEAAPDDGEEPEEAAARMTTCMTIKRIDLDKKFIEVEEQPVFGNA